MSDDAAIYDPGELAARPRPGRAAGEGDQTMRRGRAERCRWYRRADRASPRLVGSLSLFLPGVGR
jgi:hypothetical protein